MNTLIYLNLFFYLSSSLIFPTPTSKTSGWHPISFLKNYNNKPKQIEFIDTNYVLWKGDNQFHMRPNVCPHQGALLSEGKITENCIECPYHGLKVGPYDTSHSECRENYGKCIVKQDIIWWSNNANEDLSTIPVCDEINSDCPKCQMEITIQNGFSDCFKNSMDFHHAAFVHKNTFGNYAGEPESIEEFWNKHGQLEGKFNYGSNDNYGQVTGGTTYNEHIYCQPSTTYNIVRGKDDKFMIIHAAMRAISEKETKWLLTASSNFVPNGPIGYAILERMVRKVALEEDGEQLRKMASDEEKMKHSFKFKLPLDSIYYDWNKKYESAEFLEKELFNSIESNKDINILCEKLSSYNNTIQSNSSLVNTKWILLHSKYKTKHTLTREWIFKNNARESTLLKNGTIVNVFGKMEYMNKKVKVYDLKAFIQNKPNYKMNKIDKLPFDHHSFEIKYISDTLFIRKGLQSNTWEVLIKDTTY